MAGTDWHSAPSIELLAALESEPHRFDFFQLLRLIECQHPSSPRLGRGELPRDEPLRIGQPPSAVFSLSALAEPSHANVPRININFLGLLGPQGPLPAHITELARNRTRDWGDRSLQRFFEMFDHRMLLFFYRAWADSHAVVGLDRSDREDFDRFEWHLAALSGKSGREFRSRDQLADSAKMHFSGHLAALARRPGSLCKMLRSVLRVPVRLLDFHPRWLELPSNGRWRLGLTGGFSELGHNTIVGDRVFDVQCSIRIVVGPLNLARYVDFLPGGSGLETTRATLNNFLGEELEWDLNLTLHAEQVPALRLGEGSSRLGWTSWLGRRNSSEPAADLVLSPAQASALAA